MFGSSAEIKIASTVSDKCTHDLATFVRRFENDFSENLSTYSNQSKISQVNQGLQSEIAFLSPYAELFAQAKWIQKKTSGIYDITISPYWVLWSQFLNGQSQAPPSLGALEKLTGERKKQSWEIQNQQLLSKSAQFQLDSLAPGFAMDLIAKKLWARGCSSFLIEIGGEVLAQGPSPFLIGIESPELLDGPPKIRSELRNLAIGTSGLGRKGRFYQGQWFSSFIDARTGNNINHRMAQVSVGHRLGIMADALATVMMLIGPDHAWKLALEKKMPLLMFIRGDDEKLSAIANRYWVQKLPTIKGDGKLLPHENWPLVTPSAGL